MTDTTARTIHELTEAERFAAFGAFKEAHGVGPDFGFPADRGWIEGYAHASQAAPLPVAAYLVTNIPGGKPSLCFEDERCDFGDEDHVPVFESLYRAAPAPRAEVPQAVQGVTDEQIMEVHEREIRRGPVRPKYQDTVLAFARAVLALSAAPAAQAPDSWRQYAKEGETAQAVIERHRGEQDVLLTLLSKERATVGPVSSAMVDRFLGWRLPDDFSPDCGISFKALGHPNGWPIGTNLFTAEQARKMLGHVLAAPAAQASEAKCLDCGGLGVQPDGKKCPCASTFAPAEAPGIAAEPSEANIESPFNACMHREHCKGWKAAALSSPTKAVQPAPSAELFRKWYAQEFGEPCPSTRASYSFGSLSRAFGAGLNLAPAAAREALTDEQIEEEAEGQWSTVIGKAAFLEGAKFAQRHHGILPPTTSTEQGGGS